MEKNKIAIIIPYFGNFKNYFRLWIASASYNSKIDFIIVTDSNNNYNLSDNIKWISMSFREVRERIQKFIDFKICLSEPYKLCEYKPMYGLAFSDYLLDYDWWGFGDVDLIYGDLSRYITNENLSKFDKILDLGHLTLIKNSKENNYMWKKEENNVWSYKEAFKYPNIFHYDEGGGYSYIFNKNSNKVYHELPGLTGFADIHPAYKGFKLAYETESEYGYIFKWDDGKIIGTTIKNDKIVEREFTYVHLQKRKMEIVGEDIDKFVKDGFYIFPNYFKANNEVVLTKDLIINASNYVNIQDYGSLFDRFKKKISHKYIYEQFIFYTYIKPTQQKRNIPIYTNEAYFKYIENNR